MNKRGGVIGLGLLPLFALAACLASLFVFIAYDSNVTKPMSEVTQTLNTVDFNEAYIMSMAKIVMLESAQTGINKDSFTKAALAHDMHIEGQGNFFVLASENRFEITSQNGNYQLLMPDLFVIGQTNTLTIKRNINLAMEFDSAGQFRRFINK